MSWEQEYREKRMSKEMAVSQFVRSGDSVCIGGLAFAVTTVTEIIEQAKRGRIREVVLNGNLLEHYLPIDDPNITPDMIRYESFFFGPYEREALKRGSRNVTFFPMRLSGLARYVCDNRPNVTVCQVTPPDENGYMSLGPINGGTMPLWLQHSDRIIVQVNRNLPYVYGPTALLHISKVTAITEYDEELPLIAPTKVTETDQKIADFILEHIPDGACIQLGLGGTANAVGYGLKDKRELGIHTELFTESMQFLYEKGVITNSHKQFMPGVSLTGFALGSSGDYYHFLHQNKEINFVSYHISNAVENIAKNENVISINNAISMDVTGQVTAEDIGFRHFSGTGGHMDYVLGALSSKNGKSFIAFPSTAQTKGGIVSRIVLDLPPGSSCTTPRSAVQYVATEYGCVNLYGADIPTRVKRLISIAHPDFRDQLLFDAKKEGYLY